MVFQIFLKTAIRFGILAVAIELESRGSCRIFACFLAVSWRGRRCFIATFARSWRWPFAFISYLLLILFSLVGRRRRGRLFLLFARRWRRTFSGLRPIVLLLRLLRLVLRLRLMILVLLILTAARLVL